MTCRHMKRLTRVRVSLSGQSRARLPLGRVPTRSDKIQRQPNNDEPKPADAGYSSCAQPVTGPASPARAAMLFRLLSGSAAPAQSGAGEARPKQPVVPKLNQRLDTSVDRQPSHDSAYSGHFSGHARIFVQIDVQNQTAHPAAIWHQSFKTKWGCRKSNPI